MIEYADLARKAVAHAADYLTRAVEKLDGAREAYPGTPGAMAADAVLPTLGAPLETLRAFLKDGTLPEPE